MGLLRAPKRAGFVRLVSFNTLTIRIFLLQSICYPVESPKRQIVIGIPLAGCYYTLVNRTHE